MNTCKRILALVLSAQFLLSAGQSIQQKAMAIPVGSVVELRLADKSTLKGQLSSISNSGVTVKVAEAGAVSDKTVAFDNIRKISERKTGSHTTRNVLIGVAIGVGVLVTISAALMAAGWSGS